MDMIKTYDPKAFEKRLYKFWEDNGYFKGIPDKTKKPFSIVIPPPNITGQLHMGHALNNTIQDIIIRFKRMQGYSVLWQPGTDHASIATEVKIVDQMKSEGLNKNDVGRDGFLERAWKWRDKYGSRIVEQLKCLGSSCDWSREAFTMDEQCSKAVKQVFIDLYREGLIYRGNRIINWCPCCQTALSDAEVEYETQKSFLWHLRYPIEGSDKYIVIATTRPETMLGDTAVAVNPADERYRDLVGKRVLLPIVNKYIPVVADDYVEMDFGTGIVKITPAHDPNDFEVGKRHDLEVIKVMNDDGTINELGGKYAGMDRFVARKAIVEDLQTIGLLDKIEPYEHNVGTCYRCGTVVEQIVSLQWFVDMKPLATPAIDVVRNGEINFVPKRFEKIYFNWMENIKDWCISRQLWWGHRIPAYYCTECGEMVVSADAPDTCPKCGAHSFRQDEDVLDTWFSSALWPFSTLGWPDKPEYVDYYYPTSVLVTAYDIIFFWVARMIFSGMKQMKQKPFSDVLIHGIVRDNQGRKMSKSLGNGIDPLEIIDKFGADTLRFSLANGIAPGGDTRYSEEKVESTRNFMNKIWNACRFVLMNSEGVEVLPVEQVNLTADDRWILTKLNGVIREVTVNLEQYEMGLAAARLYDFVWSDFCDWYIELSKPVLYSTDAVAKQAKVSVLNYVMECFLKLLHPYIPFVTEEIYQNLQNHDTTIMTSSWPTVRSEFEDEQQAAAFENVMELIRTIRTIRSDKNIAPSKRIDIILVSNEEHKALAESSFAYIEKLAGVSHISFVASGAEAGDKCLSTVLSIGELYIPLGELIDFDKERARLRAEIAKVEQEIARSEKLLGNQGFVAKAPQKLIDAEKDKLQKNIDNKDKLEKQLEAIS